MSNYSRIFIIGLLGFGIPRLLGITSSSSSVIEVALWGGLFGGIGGALWRFIENRFKKPESISDFDTKQQISFVSNL